MYTSHVTVYTSHVILYKASYKYIEEATVIYKPVPIGLQSWVLDTDWASFVFAALADATVLSILSCVYNCTHTLHTNYTHTLHTIYIHSTHNLHRAGCVIQGSSIIHSY